MPSRYQGSRGYHSTDSHIVDYQVYEIPGVNAVFRGPPVTSHEYIACVGGAQTFGRFVQTPFPALLSRALGMEVLNLGRGGAGPTFPLKYPTLMEYINRARLAIVQVFSGRSQSNSVFRIVGDANRGINLIDGRELMAEEFYTWLMGRDMELLRKIVAETRENYVAAMVQLLKAIVPPKILFWFSVRQPEYQERWELPLSRLSGAFPQFVNGAMLDRLRKHCDICVESISRRGLPQALLDSNGKPAWFESLSAPPGVVVKKNENRYYPSPEMHEDAAALLLPACIELLGR